MHNIDEIVKQSQPEIVLTIPQLSSDEKAALARAELARAKPRSGVLKALGVDAEDVNAMDKDAAKRIVETLDQSKPFESVWVGETKHFLQNGKVYDAATFELHASQPKEAASAKK